MSSFHELDLTSLRIPGFRILNRETHLLNRETHLEDANTQVYLASRAGQQGADPIFLVKFSDVSDLTRKEVEDRLEKEQKIIKFINSLRPDEKALFLCNIACRSIPIKSKGQSRVQVIYRILEYDEKLRCLHEQETDPDFAADFNRPECLLQIFKKIYKAMAILERSGFLPICLTTSNIFCIPSSCDSDWPTKLSIDSSCLAPAGTPDIHTTNKALQALWRIHPDFGVHRTFEERSVVFTLGAIFYRILAGYMPYHRPGFLVVTERKLRSITRSPGIFESAILDMLQQSVTKRPDLRTAGRILEKPEVPAEIAAIIADKKSPEPADEFSPLKKRSLFKSRSLVIIFRILRLLREIGFGHVLAFLGIRRSVDIPAQQPLKTIGERVASALKDLGPIFIKFGQILSTRNDQFPDEFCKSLSSLQDENEPVVPFDQVSRVLLKTWKANSLGDVCVQISKDPIAVASIGQVYSARLRGGQEVVIKVLKPGIEQIIDGDLALLHWVANRLNASFAALRPFRIPEFIDHFERSLRAELLFETERLNLLELGQNLSSIPFVTVPAVIESLSGENVLVMGFLKGGVPIDNKRALQQAGIDQKLVAGRILEIFLQMILIDGVFHADPHPGNLFVMPGDKIGLVDFGMIGRLPPRRRLELLYVLFSIINNSPDRISQAFRLMGAIPPEQDTSLFEQEIAGLLSQIRVLKDHGKGPVGLGVFLTRILRIIQQHNFSLPADVYLVFKTMLIVESSVVGLSPDIDLLGVIDEKIKDIFIKKAGKTFEDALSNLVERYATATLIDTFILYRKLGESLVKINQPKALPEHDVYEAARRISRVLPGAALTFGGLTLGIIARPDIGVLADALSKMSVVTACSGIALLIIGILKK